jgi:hypothetical protein
MPPSRARQPQFRDLLSAATMTMKTDQTGAASQVLAGHPPSADNPCIEITPSPAQYRQLCRDLGALRRTGAASNTAAVIAAVRAAAADKLDGG